MAYDKVKAHEYYIKYRKKGLKKGRQRKKADDSNTSTTQRKTRKQDDSLDSRVKNYLGKKRGVLGRGEQGEEDAAQAKKRKEITKLYKNVLKKREQIAKQQEKQKAKEEKAAQKAEKQAQKQAAAQQRQAQAAQKAAQRQAAAKKKQKEAVKRQAEAKKKQKEAAQRKLEAKRNRAKIKSVSNSDLNPSGKERAKAIMQELQDELKSKVAKAKTESEVEKLTAQYQEKFQQEMDKLALNPTTRKASANTAQSKQENKAKKKEDNKAVTKEVQDQAQAVVDTLTEKMKTMSTEEKAQAKETLQETITQIEEIYKKLAMTAGA